MRKYLYAGAVAGGFLLFGAAPAHADVPPAPAARQDGAALGGLLGATGGLDPAGGLRIDDPVGGSGRLLDVKPGTNSADVPGAAGNLLPAKGTVPAARAGLGRPGDRTGSSDARPARPERIAPAGGLPGVGGGGLPTGALGRLPVANLLTGGLPLVGGLLPDGRSAGFAPAQQESGLIGGVPLLGGLGGLVPVGPAAPAASGLPAGGTAVPPQDEPVTQDQSAATDQAAPRGGPAQAGSPKPVADPATAKDARLHEEPTDPEGKGNRRAFSDGRPVAGVDPDYK
jgi:hypothetical protein